MRNARWPIFTSHPPATPCLPALCAVHILLLKTDPVRQATEKYEALLEYNELALEDLEDRLSAVRDRIPDTGYRVPFGFCASCTHCVPLKTSASLSPPHFMYEVRHILRKLGGVPAAACCG